jgi:oligopeptide transport system ATP-binding protein
MDVCRTEVPLLTPAQGSGEVACHLHTAGPRLAGASVRTLATRSEIPA